jgi:hypothetical protein
MLVFVNVLKGNANTCGSLCIVLCLQSPFVHYVINFDIILIFSQFIEAKIVILHRKIYMNMFIMEGQCLTMWIRFVWLRIRLAQV